MKFFKTYHRKAGRNYGIHFTLFLMNQRMVFDALNRKYTEDVMDSIDRAFRKEISQEEHEKNIEEIMDTHKAAIQKLMDSKYIPSPIKPHGTNTKS